MNIKETAAKSLLINCDKCKTTFKAGAEYTFSLKRVFNDEYVKLYYKCLNCDNEQLIMYETDKSLLQYNEIVELRKQLDNTDIIYIRNKLKNQIKKLISQRKQLLQGIERQTNKLIKDGYNE